MRRLLLPLALLACLCPPAPAAGAKPPPGTSVEMPYLMAPMSNDGKLLGYTYISSKLVATSQAAVIAVRDKLAFIQDAYVRDVNAVPIAKSDDPTAPDTALLTARLTAVARSIVGDDKIVTLVITSAKFAPLHPGDSTLGMVASSDRAKAMSQNVSPSQPAASEAASATPAATSEPAEPATH